MEETIDLSTVLRSSLVLVVAAAALALGGPDAAAQELPEPFVELLLSERLSELGERRLAVTKLVYPPGTSAMPHRHPAYLTVYVVSGQVESALGDAKAVLYGPGDVWYESHMQLHRVFRNPSSTEPFTVIVFALRDADHPESAPTSVNGR